MGRKEAGRAGYRSGGARGCSVSALGRGAGRILVRRIFGREGGARGGMETGEWWGGVGWLWVVGSTTD